MLDKIVPVAGDVTMPGFGISSSDLQLLLDNVSIVFNSAATVRFDEELKEALQTNVKGPRQLLALARQMKHLEVYLSLFLITALWLFKTPSGTESRRLLYTSPPYLTTWTEKRLKRSFTPLALILPS